MSKSYDESGRAAFPVPVAVEPNDGRSNVTMYPEIGMTLRDYFAGQALVGIITKHDKQVGTYEELSSSFCEVAAGAYAYADAMLAERQK